MNANSKIQVGAKISYINFFGASDSATVVAISGEELTIKNNVAERHIAASKVLKVWKSRK